MIKPGYTTTEFWTTLAGQLLALLTIVGVVQASDAATLQDAFSKCIAAIFVLVTNAWVVARYIQSRTQLKQAASRVVNGVPSLLLPLLTLVILGGFAAPAPAAAPTTVRVPACLIRVEPRESPRDDAALLAMMQQMIGLQQQSLANQQMILALLHQQRPMTPPPQGTMPIILEHRYAPPLQELPIAGRPRQELPEAGKPKQELPEAGKPKQELPEAGRPRQEPPEQGKPRQELPQMTPPKQQLPGMPPATKALPMQRYTVVHTLWGR